ncbi:hypothetical protein MVEN_02458800 [Mycena venus]|uniref:Uncharacterized protein n=1 Tax=Mycena venus TaxID=2733690 RepID=A0A8H6WX35_9AGAR|nr:hypothetical protein MVEN_02458800 [Mycena venus]
MSVSVCQVQVYRPYDPFHSLGAIPAVGGAALDSRKRTTSFSSPPRKRLHRTDSYVDLSFAVSTSPSTSAPTATPSASTPVPYTRTLRFYKEQKERRRALLRREPPVLDPSSSSRSCAPSATPCLYPCLSLANNAQSNSAEDNATPSPAAATACAQHSAVTARARRIAVSISGQMRPDPATAREGAHAYTVLLALFLLQS